MYSIACVISLLTTYDRYTHIYIYIYVYRIIIVILFFKVTCELAAIPELSVGVQLVISLLNRLDGHLPKAILRSRRQQGLSAH